MSVTIHPVETARERKRFITLQWKFYEGDPYWVPPLLADRRKILDPRKNPFFRHGDMKLFIAEKDGVPSGRIAAITNENHNRIHEDTVGFFGFFESVEDGEVAAALFDAARRWLRERGKTVMRGPMNPTVNDDVGLLVDGFDMPPVILMTYNPRYYPALLEGYGFRKAKDLYAYRITYDTVLTPKLERVQNIVRERYGITIRDVDFSRLAEELVIVKELYNRSWEKNWGAVALENEEIDALAADLKPVLAKFQEFAFFCLKHGEPIGFAVTLPDINQILITNRRGRLIPGAFKLLTQTKRISQMRIILLGVLPEHRGLGFDSVMYYEIIRRAALRGIYTGEASWVLEDNVMMNRAAKLLNAERYKTYRLYDLDI
ncbi:MAG: hypothetical protein QHI48_01110 [Bacteroidota bacterium]|nr:hypothetical protein [Bacteroidota bacterium]